MIEEDDSIEILESTSRKFLIVTATIIVVGLVMVLSSSYIYANEYYANSFYFIYRQLTFMFLGLGLASIVYFTRPNFWLKHSFIIHIAMTVLVGLTLIPGVGIEVKGASRWISFGGLNIQPGEMVKFTALLASFYYFDRVTSFSLKERLIKGMILFAPLVMLILQPDFGTFSICLMVMTFGCFLSSFPRKYFYLSLPIAFVSGLLLLISQPYRVRRLLTFLDPWENPQGSGFQIIQSLYGFANGGLLGQGLGNSNEKLFYLPEAHNDFIFSVLGEELGFLGVLFTIILFFLFVFYGLKLTFYFKNRERSMIVSILIFAIGLQAVLNMSVVLALLPTKGMNLPFISYGGSSLVANLFAIGIIMSAVRAERKRELVWGQEDEMRDAASSRPYENSNNIGIQGRFNNF